MQKTSLENIYSEHHKTRRGNFFVILSEDRGSFLKKYVGVNKKVLDIGCRDGALTSTYAEGNHIMGLDIDSEALERAKTIVKDFTPKHADLNGDWGIERESFGACVAAEVIEHLYYPEKVLEKIHTILKKDGLVLITIPHAFSLQSRIRFLLGTTKGTPLQDPTHINHFSVKSFSDILSQKFDILAVEGVYSNKFSLIRRFNPLLLAHDLMFVARKK